MIVYGPSNQSVYSVNFREMAPAACNFDVFHSNANLSKRVGGQPRALTNVHMISLLPQGGLAVTVPGELVGMKLIHDQFGRYDLF